MTYPPTFANVTITAPLYWLPTIERWLRLWSESGKRRPDFLAIECENNVVTLFARRDGYAVSQSVAFQEATTPAVEPVMLSIIDAMESRAGEVPALSLVKR